MAGEAVAVHAIYNASGGTVGAQHITRQNVKLSGAIMCAMSVSYKSDSLGAWRRPCGVTRHYAYPKRGRRRLIYPARLGKVVPKANFVAYGARWGNLTRVKVERTWFAVWTRMGDAARIELRCNAAGCVRPLLDKHPRMHESSACPYCVNAPYENMDTLAALAASMNMSPSALCSARRLTQCPESFEKFASATEAVYMPLVDCPTACNLYADRDCNQLRTCACYASRNPRLLPCVRQATALCIPALHPNVHKRLLSGGGG